MEVNPSVEVYLLAPDGRIAAHAAPPGRLRRDHVDPAPLRALLAGAPLPVLGDDPRSDGARKVFSAAPLASDGRERGWVYVVLVGEAHEALSRRLPAAACCARRCGRWRSWPCWGCSPACWHCAGSPARCAS